MIGPDSYKYSKLFEVISTFFKPLNKKPTLIFVPKSDVPPSTLQPGVSTPEATWAGIDYVPIEPIVWHNGNHNTIFTVHSPQLFQAWTDEMLAGIDAAIKGVLDLAHLLNIEIDNENISALLDAIQIKIFDMIKSQPSGYDIAILLKHEQFVKEDTCEIINNVCNVLCQLKRIFAEEKTHLASLQNTNEQWHEYVLLLKPESSVPTPTL